MERELVAEQWKHKLCRSSKIGHPVFDGRYWRCSRCGAGHGVSTEGASQEVAESMFWKYLANDIVFEFIGT